LLVGINSETIQKPGFLIKFSV